MNLKSRQRGVTMWGMFMISLLVVFFALLLFKLIPPYLQDLKVRSALDSIEQEARSGMSNREIMTALQKRFDIDDVEHVDLADVTIERQGKLKVINIQYEAVVHLVANISALMEFEHSAGVPTGE
ncbi:MAG: DUF4845 domain-containing protein [Gammaproteobacteria bacterium]|jgi:predicted lipid carrier protein YhbT|nr:DUF4845 domain-containing protein [Gammaproteobacteria bacterium]